jgi:hypothetical protein
VLKFLHIALVVGCAAGAVSLAGEPAAAPEVEVRLQSGRSFWGKVDPRTSQEQLWLRSQTSAGVVVRPIDWDRVLDVQHDGARLTREAFRPLADQVKDRLSPWVIEPRFVEIVPPPAIEIPLESVLPASDAPLLVSSSGFPVCSLQLGAYVASWDADPEVDGVVVHLFALSGDGALQPAAGTLEATLVGRRLASRKHTEQFPELGHWTKAIFPADWGPAGAIVRLPFQAAHPEFDFSIGPQGALNVRLVVPGQGTFEATASMVRLRPYSSLRDQLQMRERTRFFNAERPTGR